MTDLSAIDAFLPCRTPESWVEQALAQPDILLIDHAHCEKKAAATAVNLMFRYAERPGLPETLSQLAREELLHFEQVLEIMRGRGLAYRYLPPSRYAAALRAEARSGEPGRLVDVLIICALIEARSCERFAALAPRVDADLGRYYRYLLKSESRHFRDYLDLARRYAPDEVDPRVAHFKALERELITSPDEHFRFHSGTPGRGARRGLPSTGPGA